MIFENIRALSTEKAGVFELSITAILTSLRRAVKFNSVLEEVTKCRYQFIHVSTDDQLDLISSYFKQGYTNLEMLEVLKLHGITITIKNWIIG